MLLFLEIAVLLIVFVIQLVVFTRTMNNIRNYKAAIPLDNEYKIFSKEFVAGSLTPQKIWDLQNSEVLDDKSIDIDLHTEYNRRVRNHYMRVPEDIRDYEKSKQYAYQGMIEKYGLNWDAPKKEEQELVNINFLYSGDKNGTIGQIFYQINTYLFKNKGAVADFNLLKDIIDRNIEAKEEEISATLPLPIYLGLMGTMAGIVFGLFGIPSEFLNGTNVDTLDFNYSGGANEMQNLSTLINGVKYAMSVSCIGLLLTIINSGWVYKDAKIEVNQRKNLLFTFLQTELLPVLSESVNTGIINLNRRLETFGNSFNNQLRQLEQISNATVNAMQIQLSVLSRVEKIDLTKLSKFNIGIYEELMRSIEEIRSFSDQLKSLNNLFGNINSLVENTSDIAKISSEIKLSLNQAADLQKFFHSHFVSLENADKLFVTHLAKQGDTFKNAVTDLQQSSSTVIDAHKKQLDKDFNTLTEFLQDKLTILKDVKVKDEELMQLAYEENKEALAYLKLLPEIKKGLSSNKELDKIASTLGNLLSDVREIKKTKIRDSMTMQVENNGLSLKGNEKLNGIRKKPFWKRIFNFRKSKESVLDGKE